jgi:predicted acyltransferase
LNPSPASPRPVVWQQTPASTNHMAELTAAPDFRTRAKSSASAPVMQRLMSVDALRGFDMFWIIGADSLVQALNRMTKNPVTEGLANQLEHAVWQGFHFYDLIFPMFVFIMGVSTVFSLSKIIQQHGRIEALQRVVRRSILLFIIALIYSGGVSTPWPDIRLLGVLNRIALCYFFGGLIFCFCKPRVMVALAVALLMGYWAIMALVPIRDIRMAHYKADEFPRITYADNDVDKIMADTGETDPAKVFYGTTNLTVGKYEMGYNVSNHFDFMHLPGRKWDTYWDPEGILSTMPAIVTCLLGIFAGYLLKNTNVPEMKKVYYLVGFGVLSVCLGFLWGTQFPVVKKIWTSSYVLVAGGYSSILLGCFFLVVDVLKFRFWCQPFVWIGMNSITLYLTSNFLGGFRKLGLRLAGGDVKAFFDAHVAQGFGDLMVSATGLLLVFWFAHFLYRKKIFIRL